MSLPPLFMRQALYLSVPDFEAPEADLAAVQTLVR